MSALLELYLNQFLVFVLVLTRISGLILTAPILGARGAPMRVRAFLVLGLALVVAPLYWDTDVSSIGNLLGMVVALVRELVLGLSMGLAILILFGGLQITGQLISQVSGMSLGDVYDPTLDANVTAIGQMLDWVAMVIFVGLGGHRHVLGALLDTFRWMPPGRGQFAPEVLDAILEVTTQSFSAGLRASAPVMVALVLAVLITGLISRTLPQLNIFAVGFNLNAFVMMGTLMLTLGAATWVFQDQLESALDTIHGAFGAMLDDKTAKRI